jgi:transposase InsO family protein
MSMFSASAPTIPATVEQLEYCQALATMEEAHHAECRCCMTATGAGSEAVVQVQVKENSQDPTLPAEPTDPATSSNPDIWGDYYSLYFLRFGQHKAGTTPKEKQRVWKRLKAFRWLSGALQRRMADGTWKTVPAPHQRTATIMQCHTNTGHWGAKRTHHMVGLQFWWSNMKEDVATVLRTCVECSRIKASFSSPPAQLQPLTIEGLFYRWSVDLCGPFPISKRGNRYVMVMIDSFSKQVEVEALPDKTAATTAYAFVKNVLCRYGACAEVVTDQGAEFLEEFHHALSTALIDHRTTSANHPSANGLAERMVQSIKRALEKYAALGDLQASIWDEYLPMVALGYRVSVQASLGFSPYELLYGTKAIIPPSIHEAFKEPLELANPEQAAVYLMQRAEALQRHCAIAAQNLRIAQHRDTLRYKKMRSGYYNTTPTKFSPGDLIYVRRPNDPKNLQGAARNAIYRVREVRDSGTLVVNGHCGTTIQVHSTRCAPCHLANINPAIDSSKATIPAGHACDLCGSAEREEVMLICDGCLKGYHLDCLDPPLDTIPAESPWCCTDCIEKGLTPAILDELLRKDQREQGVDRPILQDQQQVMEDKAAAMDQQPVLIRILEAGRAPTSITAKLSFIPRDQREYARRPLLIEAAGFQPAAISVSKAQQATRSRLDLHLNRELDSAANAQYITMAFTASRDAPPAAPGATIIADSYLLHTAEGFRALYQDALGNASTLPRQGIPHEWMPELEWILAVDPAAIVDPLQAADMKLLFNAIDLQSCFRVADPVGQSPALQAAVLQRYQRQLLSSKSSPPHPSNWLTPGHYRSLAIKGPVDWAFLYPPLSIADLALSIAVSRTRIGAALWVPRAYLSNLTAARLQLLSAFKLQRRLVIVQGWDSNYVWVCVFASATHRTRMLCPCSATSTSWTTF